MAGDATQKCLEQTILKDPSGNTKFNITSTDYGAMKTTLVLPSNLVCSHCVFQVNFWAIQSILKTNLFPIQIGKKIFRKLY